MQTQTSGLRTLANYSRIGPNAIRLLRGYSSEQGELRGDLKTFPLDSPDLPPFYAVSYSWGSPVYKNSINIGDNQLQVADSLYPFLDIAFKERPGTWWWIDSLCINQNDNSEKGCQVPLMGEIFRTADKTVVWLGEENEDSDEAIEFLNLLGKGFYYPLQHDCRWAAVEAFFQRLW
jgi:hypothetical protein